MISMSLLWTTSKKTVSSVFARLITVVGSMNIFYLKPHEPSAPRIAYDDIRALAKKLEEIQQAKESAPAEQSSQVAAQAL